MLVGGGGYLQVVAEGAAQVLVAPERTMQGSRRHRVAAVEQHLRMLRSHPFDVPGRGGAEQAAEQPGDQVGEKLLQVPGQRGGRTEPGVGVRG